MQDTHDRPPTPDEPYPRLLHFPNSRRTGILLGHTPAPTPLLTWCRTTLPHHAAPLIQITRALVDNAHHHSSSGLPGGTVRVVLDQTLPLLPHLYVTDEGPRPDDPLISYPHLLTHAPCSGLALVERLSVYWDFSWAWDGHRIRALTMQVVLDTTDPNSRRAL